MDETTNKPNPAPRGRPAKYGEPMQSIAARVPGYMRKAIIKKFGSVSKAVQWLGDACLGVASLSNEMITAYRGESTGFKHKKYRVIKNQSALYELQVWSNIDGKWFTAAQPELTKGEVLAHYANIVVRLSPEREVSTIDLSAVADDDNNGGSL